MDTGPVGVQVLQKSLNPVTDGGWLSCIWLFIAEIVRCKYCHLLVRIEYNGVISECRASRSAELPFGGRKNVLLSGRGTLKGIDWLAGLDGPNLPKNQEEKSASVRRNGRPRSPESE